jgi:hypothetical protein
MDSSLWLNHHIINYKHINKSQRLQEKWFRIIGVIVDDCLDKNELQ